ncbi:MAG: hypothetical protein WBS15_10445 [Mycobacterium sp.]|uniref:hypothetical protein n=1 Tax=Mycobacterium sp. TaxID=1785 RepID=UPI003BB71A89
MNRLVHNSFQELSETLPATTGIAIATAVGSSAVSFGTWSTGVAWSTIKVPLAIAALRAGSDSAELVFKTITQSDNGAAEELWSQLGDPAEAAQRVQAVIHEAGDTATVVESRRLRSEYTPFGQTQWSLAHQAQFAAGLPHIPDASRVVDLTRNLSTDHRWGLAAKGFAGKGGWGPGKAGDYLVRQFAIVPTGSGTLGVALAAETHDGEYEAGVDVVDTLADWVVDHLSELTQE